MFTLLCGIFSIIFIDLTNLTTKPSSIHYDCLSERASYVTGSLREVFCSHEFNANTKYVQLLRICLQPHLLEFFIVPYLDCAPPPLTSPSSSS